MAMQPLGGNFTISATAQTLAAALGYPAPGGGVGSAHTMRVAVLRAGASNSNNIYISGKSTVTNTGTDAQTYLQAKDSLTIDFQAMCPPDNVYVVGTPSDTLFVMFFE